MLQLCLRDQLGFWGFTHRTRESLASAGSTLLELVATRKIDPTHGEGLLGKSPISPCLVLGRSSSSRCPSRNGKVSVEEIACRLWACLSGLLSVALWESERVSSVSLGRRGAPQDVAEYPNPCGKDFFVTHSDRTPRSQSSFEVWFTN